jgi:hypothetical protein
MHKVKLLSAALLTAATFATPALAATTSRHVVTDTNGRVMSTMQRDEGDSCIRAPRVGAFATAMTSMNVRGERWPRAIPAVGGRPDRSARRQSRWTGRATSTLQPGPAWILAERRSCLSAIDS